MYSFLSQIYVNSLAASAEADMEVSFEHGNNNFLDICLFS